MRMDVEEERSEDDMVVKTQHYGQIVLVKSSFLIHEKDRLPN